MLLVARIGWNQEKWAIVETVGRCGAARLRRLKLVGLSGRGQVFIPRTFLVDTIGTRLVKVRPFVVELG